MSVFYPNRHGHAPVLSSLKTKNWLNHPAKEVEKTEIQNPLHSYLKSTVKKQDDIEAPPKRPCLELTEQCVVCCGTDDGKDASWWLERSVCEQWVHEECLPIYLPYGRDDDDFLCPQCLCNAWN